MFRWFKKKKEVSYAEVVFAAREQANIYKQKFEDRMFENYIKHTARSFIEEQKYNKYALLIQPPYRNGVYKVYNPATAKYLHSRVGDLISEEIKKQRLDQLGSL